MGRLWEAFCAGLASYDWAGVDTAWNGHVAQWRISSDAPRIVGTRWACSAREAQQIADLIGACLPTPALLDARHDQARTKIEPCPQYPCTATDAAIRKHSASIDMLARHGAAGIVSPVGKQWCLGRTEPCLYGWHVPSATWKHGRRTWRGIPVHPAATLPGEYVIQPESSGGHSLDHWDYSMLLLLVHGEVIVDGQRMATADVYTDPALCGLATGSDAPLRAARYTGVPYSVEAAVGDVGRAIEAAAGKVVP